MRAWLACQKSLASPLLSSQAFRRGLTDVGIREYHQGVGVVHPFDAEPSLFPFPLFEHGLKVARLETGLFSDEPRPTSSFNVAHPIQTHSGVKLAKCRIRVTAAETDALLLEGAGMNVPLGSEMDMVLIFGES